MSDTNTELEYGGANVYLDIAAQMPDEMLVKARLASKIAEIIRHRHLTQSEAALIVGLPQPKLSGLLRGQFRGISESKMLDCLNKLGRDVQIVVKKSSRKNVVGKTSVVFA